MFGLFLRNALFFGSNETVLFAFQALNGLQQLLTHLRR